MATTTMGSQNGSTPASKNVIWWVAAGVVILAFVIFYAMRNSATPSPANMNRGAASSGSTYSPDTVGAPNPAGNTMTNGAVGTDNYNANGTTTGSTTGSNDNKNINDTGSSRSATGETATETK